MPSASLTRWAKHASSDIMMPHQMRFPSTRPNWAEFYRILSKEYGGSIFVAAWPTAVKVHPRLGPRRRAVHSRRRRFGPTATHPKHALHPARGAFQSQPIRGIFCVRLLQERSPASAKIGLRAPNFAGWPGDVPPPRHFNGWCRAMPPLW